MVTQIEPSIPQTPTLRRKVGVLVVSLALAAGIALVPSPANAATWHVVRTWTSCNGGSWGQQCVKHTEWKRAHDSYCASRPFPGSLSYLAWYNYCYKTTSQYL